MQPWRNGGGVTRDIAVFPEGAGDDDFLWRASIATIAAPGAFSEWPGVDRALLPLDGALTLAIEGIGERRLQAGEPALHFAGEAMVHGIPIGGASTVLNIMVRRGGTRMQLERANAWRPSTADHILLLVEDAATIGLNDESLHLNPHDALLFSHRNIVIVKIENGDSLVIVQMVTGEVERVAGIEPA